MKILALVLISLLALPGLANAEIRNALVIGNADYQAVGALDNPANDAQLMAQTLRDLDFNVIEVIDASQIEMKRAVRDFGARLSEAGRDGIGLFYYAGHGLQLGGANYIIPVDARIDSAGDVDIESVNANSVLRMMEFSQARLSFVILDACRNNPYSRGFRSTTRGLAKMNAPTGSLIAYATSPGDVAVDGDGSHSPYTAALVENLSTPGVPIEKMFRNVRNEVRSATENRQTPWESSSLIGDDFYFSTTVEIANKPGGQEITVNTEVLPVESDAEAELAVQPIAMQPVVIRNENNIELVYWDSVKDSQNPDLLRAYIGQYPEGIFTELAQLKLAALEGNAAQLVAAQTASEPVSQPVVESVPEPAPSPQLETTPEPVTLAVLNQANSGNTLRPKLDECAAHIKARRLTTGAGGNALDCYRVVLDRDPGNAEALDGLTQIENKYAQWASVALDRGNVERAERNIIKLSRVNGDSRALSGLEQRLDSLTAELQRKKQESETVKVAKTQPQKKAEPARAVEKEPSQADREDALVAEFREEVSDKSLEMAKRTMNELRRLNPQSSHLRKMRRDYEELKMEMRW